MFLWPHAAGPKSKDANAWKCIFYRACLKVNELFRGAENTQQVDINQNVIDKYSILWVMQTSRQALMFGQNLPDFCIWLLETVTTTVSMDETTGWCNARMHDDMIFKKKLAPNKAKLYQHWQN